ncbi:TPA: hypothetical protein MCR44_003795 [Klebsiella pneumoniae]|nr:hypothetical protein [Klebsiella pneumoniae]
METKDHKKVIQYSDQFFCSWCGKTWDANDPYPPECSVKKADVHTIQRSRDLINYRAATEAAIDMSILLRDGVNAGPVWPTMPQAYYLQRRGVGFVVWANGPKEAYNYAVRVGMRPTYMRRIDIPDRAYDVKTPRAEINPLTLELVRSRYPNFGEVVTPVQFVSRQKEKRK